MTFAVSGSSAMMSLPAVTYMTPLIDERRHLQAVDAGVERPRRLQRATLAGVICFSGEKRWPPASWSCDGQSLTSAATSRTRAPRRARAAASIFFIRT